MTATKAQRQSVIDTPKTEGNYTLYPVTFGLRDWLDETVKSPLIHGGEVQLKHVMEVCYAFTMDSSKLVEIPKASIASKVKKFQTSLTPDEFNRIQKHAESELLKFQQTSVLPKKKQAHQRMKVKR